MARAGAYLYHLPVPKINVIHGRQVRDISDIKLIRTGLHLIIAKRPRIHDCEAQMESVHMTVKVVLAYLPHNRPSTRHMTPRSFSFAFILQNRVWVFKCRLHCYNKALLKWEADTAEFREVPGPSAIVVTEGGRERFAANLLVCVLCRL